MKVVYSVHNSAPGENTTDIDERDTKDNGEDKN
jgi:hypothetical protein